MENEDSNQHLEIAFKRRTHANKLNKSKAKLRVEFLNPFYIFPEELWGLIIEVAEEPVLQNLFAAIPKFFNVFKKFVSILQFDQDINKPTVFRPNNNSADNVRTELQLVTNDWCQALDIFVNSHSLQQFQNKPKEFTKFQYVFRSKDKHPRLHSFKSVAQINKYKVNETLEIAEFICKTRSNRVQFFQSSVRLLDEHGANLQYLWLQLDTNNFPDTTFEGAKQVFNLIIGCLRRVQNIKKLIVVFDDSPYCQHLQGMFEACQDYPKLASLRYLCVAEYGNTATNSVLKYFLRGYICKGYVRQLTIQNIQKQFTSREVYDLDNTSHTLDDLIEFKKHLKTNCCTQISMLFPNDQQNNSVGHFLQWLSSEQYVVSKILITNQIPNNTLYKPTLPLKPIPSVKYLKIAGASILDYNFLRAFTNLEHLHIYCSRRKYKRDYLQCDRNYHENKFTKLVCNYLYEKDFQKGDNIWKIFASLKTFVVQDERMFCKHFVRCLGNKPLLFKE